MAKSRTSGRSKGKAVDNNSIDASGLPFTIEPPNSTRHLNTLAYGMSGVGKTWLCGTITEVPEACPALLVNTDKGTLTLDGLDQSLIQITTPKNWSDLQNIYRYFRNDNNQYKTLLIDGLSEIQRRFSMGGILGELDDDEFKNFDVAVAPNRQDWLRSGEQMRKYIRAHQDLAYLEDPERRVHIVFTCLERYDEKKKTVCPGLPGQLGLECGAFMDILVRLSKVRDEDEDGQPVVRRHLLTDEYEDEDGVKYLAKNRGGRLGVQLWDPTMARIIGVWRE